VNPTAMNGLKSVTEALDLMEAALHQLAASIDAPVMTALHGGRPAHRYSKQGIEQAIVPKMARVISTTRAALLLLEASYLGEYNALKRMVDEAVEDIMFLARGLELGAKDEHQEYLDSFFTEYWKDGSHPDVPDLHKRPEFSRYKLRKYMDDLYTNGPTLPGDAKVSGLMRRSYTVDSGYVHGNCSQLMELYGGNPPSYHVSGVPHPTAILGAALTLLYSVAMALTTFATAARAFGDAELTERLRARSVQLYKLAVAMQNTFQAWERSNHPMTKTD